MTIYLDALEYLEDIGFYEVALPFLLIFTLIFAILQKIKIFGDDSKKFNVIIAASMAFFVIRSEFIIEVMNNFIPQVSLAALVIVSILILVGIFLGQEEAAFGGQFGGIGVLVILAAVLLFLLSSGAFGTELPYWLEFDFVDLNLVIAIGSFLVFVWLIGGKPVKTGKNSWDWLGKLGDSLGKGGKA
jgi:hypothetical protein